MMNRPQTEAPGRPSDGADRAFSTHAPGLRAPLGGGKRAIRAGRLQRAAVQAVCVAAMCLTLAACDRPLDANSSCQDFLRAPVQARDSAVNNVALALHIRGAGSPLVLPNVEYLCGNSPAATLGNAVQHSAS